MWRADFCLAGIRPALGHHGGAQLVGQRQPAGHEERDGDHRTVLGRGPVVRDRLAGVLGCARSATWDAGTRTQQPPDRDSAKLEAEWRCRTHAEAVWAWPIWASAWAYAHRTSRTSCPGGRASTGSRSSRRTTWTTTATAA